MPDQDAIQRHLRHEPTKQSKSRIKRLRGLARPQFRLRVMKKIALPEAKDDLSRVLRMAEGEDVVITRHGKPAGVLIGFKSEDDWFDYRLQDDPRFLARVETARKSLRTGRGVKLEDVRR